MPAGTFDCFRVESEYTAISYPEALNRSLVRWYCPPVKYIAKEISSETVTTKQGFGRQAIVTSELERFTAGP